MLEIIPKAWEVPNWISFIPKNGCIYIGTNIQDPAGVDFTVDEFKDKYGKPPTFVAPGFGRVGAINGTFPYYIREAHRVGAIPMVRYVVTPKSGTWRDVGTWKGYSEINRGLMDEEIKEFGAEAAKLEKPILACPFQQPNDTQSDWRAWAGPSTASAFKDAYARIHRIWKQEGALDKVVMGVKLKTGSWPDCLYPDPLRFIPPKEIVDSIGWCVNNICQPNLYTPSDIPV